jgi:hypothetical protein
VSEDEDKQERDKGFTLVFIINGEDYPTRVDPRLPLSLAVQRVLTDSGNTARPAEEWEVRDASGVLLETNRTPHDLRLHNGARLFVSLKVGAGGVGQNRS